MIFKKVANRKKVIAFHMEFCGLILVLKETPYGLPSIEIATEIPDSAMACYQMKAESFKSSLLNIFTEILVGILFSWFHFHTEC